MNNPDRPQFPAVFLLLPHIPGKENDPTSPSNEDVYDKNNLNVSMSYVYIDEDEDSPNRLPDDDDYDD